MLIFVTNTTTFSSQHTLLRFKFFSENINTKSHIFVMKLQDTSSKLPNTNIDLRSFVKKHFFVANLCNFWRTIYRPKHLVAQTTYKYEVCIYAYAYRSPRKFSINSVKTLVNNSNSNQNQMVKSSQLKTETSRTANCFPLSIKRRKKEVNYCDFHLVLLNKKKVKRSKSIIVESSRGQAALSARYRLGRSYTLI